MVVVNTGGPKVPESHVIGRAGKELVRGALPSSWCKTEPAQGDDYGDDLVLDIVRDGHVTPEKVVLQLKSSKTRPTSIRIATSTLRRLVDLPNPTFLVAVCLDTKEFWLVPCRDNRAGRLLERAPQEGSIELTVHDKCDGTELGRRIDILSFRDRIATDDKTLAPVWLRAMGWQDSESRQLLRAAASLLAPLVHIDSAPPVRQHLVHADVCFTPAGPPADVRDIARPTRKLLLRGPVLADKVVELALHIAVSLDDIGLHAHGVAAIAKALPRVKSGEVRLDELRPRWPAAKQGRRGPRRSEDGSTGQEERGIGACLQRVYSRLGANGVVAVLDTALSKDCDWVVPAFACVWMHLGQLPAGFWSRMQSAIAAHRAGMMDLADVARSFANEAYAAKQMGEFDRAICLLAAAAEAHDGYLDFGHFWSELGGCAFLTDHVDDACSFYLAGLNREPMDPFAWQNTMHVLCCAGRWAEVELIAKHRPDSMTSASVLFVIIARYWREHAEAPKVERSVAEELLCCRTGLLDLADRRFALDLADLARGFSTWPKLLWAAAQGAIDGGIPGHAFMWTLTAACQLEDDAELWADCVVLSGQGLGPENEGAEGIWSCLLDQAATMTRGQAVWIAIERLDPPVEARKVLVAYAAEASDNASAARLRYQRPVALTPRPRNNVPIPVVSTDADAARKLLRLRIPSAGSAENCTAEESKVAAKEAGQ